MLEKLEGSEVVLIAALSLYALAGAAGVAFDGGGPEVAVDPVVVQGPVEAGHVDAAEWFQRARPHCNPVEVETHMGWQPAPETPDGEMHKAACYALAGKIERARESIESLPPGLRYRAAGVVFEAGHPAADAGDDIAAGPLMELVVEYWPNHYMALYHAGAARFELGDRAEAGEYLRRFLKEYQADDGWTRNAREMLEAVG